MLPQWPWVVWASTLQFPSNGEAIADGVEQMVAEAAARAMAPIRLPMPIMGVLLTDQPNPTQFFSDDLMRGLGTAAQNKCPLRASSGRRSLLYFALAASQARPSRIDKMA